jgi:DNA-binding MarR family transcriptional regulator
MMFLRVEPINMIVLLSYEMSISQLHKKTASAYDYVLENIHIFEKKRLVKVRIEGRKRMVSLTRKGKELREYLLNIKKELEETK